MNKTINLILGIFAIATVAYSFVGDSAYEKFLGFEVNIWVYRLIWTVLAAGLLYDYSRKKKVE